MKKLSILSAFLFWSVFWTSLYLVLSYIFDAHGIRDYSPEGWFGHIWFGFTILIVNVTAWYFPLYYLQLVSYLRKIQRDNEKDYRAGKSEPYFYDFSGFFYKIRHNFKNHVERDVRSFIWDYKDMIRENIKKSKLKQGVSLDQEAECYKNPNQPIKIPKKVEDAISKYLGKKSKEKYDTKTS